MTTLRELLVQRKVLERIIVPAEIDMLLGSLVIQAAQIPDDLSVPWTDMVQGGINDKLLGFASININPGGPKAQFTLTIGPGAAFRVDLVYEKPFVLPAALKGALPKTAGDDRYLEAAAGDAARVKLKNLAFFRIAGSETTPTTLRLITPGADDVVQTIEIDPPAFLFGGSAFGLHLPGGLVLDDSRLEPPPPPVNGEGSFASSQPEWRGIAIRGAELYLPKETPLIGKTPIPVDLELTSPTGVYGRTRVKIPEQGKRPELTCTVEWQDPQATMIGLPTSVEIEARWDIDGKTIQFHYPGYDAPFQLGGGKPLIARARYTHDLRDDQMKFNLAVEGGGPNGLIAVHAADGATVPKVFVTAAAMATALMADAQTNPDPDRDASGTTLHYLLAAATALSAFAKNGSVVVHGVAVEGNIAIASGPLRMRVDYSVDVVVKPIKLGVMSISMSDTVPMRIRYRDVLLELDFTKTGPEMFSVSFNGCSTLVEDPGGWIVDSPGSLLDILGTRSGHGSQWMDIDLRFALDLGPVKVSGATVRAIYAGGEPRGELRGLDVTLQTAPLVTGRGSARITETGFDAALAGELPALKVGAAVSLEYTGNDLLLLGVGLDLPAPIPLASTGLGIFGLGGLFGINGTMKPIGANDDPVRAFLGWNFLRPPYPVDQRKGGLLLGLSAVLGTIPDTGFSFNTKAVVLASTPDVAVRAGLEAGFLRTPPKLADVGNGPPPIGASIIGLLSIDDTAVALGLRGTFDMRPLITVVIPVAARFPYSNPDWFVHIGSDQVNQRAPGPIIAQILPDLIDMGGWAFLMIRGDGITNFAGLKYDLKGLALGAGFGFDMSVVMVPVWLEMSAHAFVGLATNPFMLIGSGGLEGTLHLGPFSLGVSAEVKFQRGPADAKMVFLKVCGEVDLWFTSISGCVEIGADNIQADIPDPGKTILESVHLLDHNGRLLKNQPVAAPDTAGEPPEALPAVWPDTLLALEFSTGPLHAVNPEVLKNINTAQAGQGKYGSDELHYTYTLTGLDLQEYDRDTQTWASVNFGSMPGQGAWQIPRYSTGSDPNASGARELVLLTGDTHIWTRNLTDGGAGLKPNPIKGMIDDCGADEHALRGWALGRDANRRNFANWRLPGEGSPLERFASYFEVDVDVLYRDLELSSRAAGAAGRPEGVHDGGPVEFITGLDGERRKFSGGLLLPHFDVLSRERSGLGRATARLTTSEPLLEAELYLLWQGPAPSADDLTVQALFAGNLPPLDLDPSNTIPVDTGQVLIYQAQGQGKVVGFSIYYDAAASLILLGVSGYTAAAVDAADAATKNKKKGQKLQKDAADAPPCGKRPLLKANTAYKLVATVSVVGERKGATKPFDDQVSVYYFRTAPLKKEIIYFQMASQNEIMHAPSAFEPAYLARYIAGWTPLDRAEAWFCKDPVAVHFTVDYIACLAEQYGHKVVLRRRRSDTPPGSPDDKGVAFLKESIVSAVSSLGYSAADQLLATEMQSAIQAGWDCKIGLPGSTLIGGSQPALDPDTQYELTLEFPETASPDRAPLIPGISFHTSRYNSPADLLNSLGFSTGAVPGTPTGDVEVVPADVGGSASGDLAVQYALDCLGQPGWPAAAAARTSVLWAKSGGAWLVAGVLLEAPEPIHRTGAEKDRDRLKITGLKYGGQAFDIQRFSASGSRLLFLASTPLPPNGALELSATEVLPDAPLGTAPTPITAHCNVAAVPAFVEESL